MVSIEIGRGSRVLNWWLRVLTGQWFFLILDEGWIKNDRDVLIKKNMGPKIRALLIYECVCSMKPIKIDGVRVGGVSGYALIFTGVRDKLLFCNFLLVYTFLPKIHWRKNKWKKTWKSSPLGLGKSQCTSFVHTGNKHTSSTFHPPNTSSSSPVSLGHSNVSSTPHWSCPRAHGIVPLISARSTPRWINSFFFSHRHSFATTLKSCH